VKCEPQTSVAEPWDARVNTRLFEFRIEIGQDRCGRCLMCKPIDADLDEVAASLYPPLDPVDELAMDQLWRLLLIGSSEVMPEVVDHVERQQTQ
jgi:hypothetical protein